MNEQSICKNSKQNFKQEREDSAVQCSAELEFEMNVMYRENNSKDCALKHLRIGILL
jgi:transposase-like protein